MSPAPEAPADILLRGEQDIDVLMIDDDPKFCDLIAEGLAATDDTIAVETTNSPTSGLDILDERTPDCIVSDYDMPEMSGIELLETIREDYPKLPFILYTSKGDETVASEAITAGTTDYLVKGYGSEHYDHLSTLIQAIVTERRKERLEAKNQEMIQLAEISSDAGGFEIDVTDETVLVTGGALRILDPSEDASLTEKRLDAIFDDEAHAAITQAAERLLSTGESESITVTYQRSDADRRVLRMIFMATTAENPSTSVRGVIKDITEQHEQERQIEVFDRVLRHNLRNDLNLIRGTAETVASKTTAEIADLSTQIVSKSDRLLETVSVQRDIMAILRDDPEYEAFDLEDVLQQVAAKMSDQYPAAELTVECPAGLSVEASSHLTRAVTELVQNAIEHNDVRQTEVQLVAQQTDDATYIEIADNGPPIPDMERDVLIEPRERTPLYHGSGLGLWFVKLIIFRSNGEITFAENEPHGNIITIEIPA